MIEVSNLRKQAAGDYTRLIADIAYAGEGFPDTTDSLWFAVKNENAHMLADDVYDAFILMPLYAAMYYKHDLRICGCVSKKLYRNIMNYVQKILCNFSENLSRVNIYVDGYKETEGRQSIIGSSFSCGIDSLTTVYDRYVCEDDPEYRINGLFMLDYGPVPHEVYIKKAEHCQRVADELGLPFYFIDSNLREAFYEKENSFIKEFGYQKLVHLSIYSSVFALGKSIKRYYIPSSYSYDTVLRYGRPTHHDRGLACSESFMVPLIQTERTELILDGSQYKRSEKTERIAGWEIAQKYLDVCYTPLAGCSRCNKCVRTLMALEALGKLENFSGIFDIGLYTKNCYMHKCRLVTDLHKNSLSASAHHPAYLQDSYDLYRKYGLKLPSLAAARMYIFVHSLPQYAKRLARKLIGEKLYSRIKGFVKP